MKIVGNKLALFLLLMLIFLACKSKNNLVISKNYFNENYFYNDSLKTGINFWGALNFENMEA